MSLKKVALGVTTAACEHLLHRFRLSPSIVKTGEENSVY
jgi:hypothetical protein